jgi:hypothetical protein
MKLSGLWAASIPWEAKFPNGTVRGKLNPYFFSGDYLSGKTVPQAICGGLVTEWDLEEDDGSPMPLDPERLAKAPDWVIGGLWSSIQELQSPNRTGSAPTAST